MPKEPGRLQVDLRNLPLSVVPALKVKAIKAGCTLTGYLRSIIIEAALKGDSATYILPEDLEPWEPVR